MEKTFGQLTSAPLNETGPVRLWSARSIVSQVREFTRYERICSDIIIMFGFNDYIQYMLHSLINYVPTRCVR